MEGECGWDEPIEELVERFYAAKHQVSTTVKSRG